MRSNAGTSQEPLIIVAGLGLSAVVGYKIWKPWGALAGPGALIAAVALITVVGIAVMAWSGSSSRNKLFKAARRKAALPRPEWVRLVGSASIRPEHRAEVMAVAADPTHPLCEPFLCLAIRLDDAEANRLIASYVGDHPAACWGLMEHAAKTATPELLERVALAAIASTEKYIPGMVAGNLLRRAKKDAAAADVVRRFAAKIEPHLAEWERNDLNQI